MSYHRLFVQGVAVKRPLDFSLVVRSSNEEQTLQEFDAYSTFR